MLLFDGFNGSKNGNGGASLRWDDASGSESGKNPRTPKK
jgi:hypothetical protein